ncbi:hypothetical protein OG21DRAFT_365226 [Imleria badia]|nr:hypothetical protein OG21DRAFT_365226 [Imleria badia]
MPTTLTSPPGACCWTGIKHVGTPEGRIEPLGGLNTYISEPPPNALLGPHKKVLLFLADAYGPLFINNKLLQDYFASQGFTVLGPDYFFGVPVQNLPPDRDKVAWSLEARAAAIEVFPTWFEGVRATYGTEAIKYIAVGYCFGAPFVLDLAAEGSIVAGAIAHPGFLEDSHFQKLNSTSFEQHVSISSAHSPIGPLLLSCAGEVQQ